MTMGFHKQIRLDNSIVSFQNFHDEFETYISNLHSMFRTSTLTKHAGESDLHFHSRIFGALYYRKGLAASIEAASAPAATRRTRKQRNAQAPAEDPRQKVLDLLGIDLVRQNSKSSKILFKNSGNRYKINNEELDSLINSIRNGDENAIRTVINDTHVNIGVELEFIGDDTAVSKFNEEIVKIVGEDKYSCLLRYNHNQGQKWILGYDGSLSGDHILSHETGYELTSPILDPDKREDMETLSRVLDLINSVFKGYTNRSCGTHIHMSFVNGVDHLGVPMSVDAELLKFFSKSYGRCEDKVFDAVVPKRRRNDSARYCKSCKGGVIHSRYRKLNTLNARYNSNSTHLEFRQLEGTLDFTRIHAWIKLQKLFVELTLAEYRKNKDERKHLNISIGDIICKSEVFNSEDIEGLMKGILKKAA